MKLSTRGRYGLRALMELAGRQGEDPMLMETIARNQDLSRKYLHAILSKLREAGFVRSVRGARGGYSLARSPEEIRLDEVIRVLEGSIAVTDCVEDGASCERSENCPAREVWSGLSRAIETFLGGKTLSDLLEVEKE